MKILNIKKDLKPWEPDHKNYTLYSAWVTLDYKGKEVPCKLACFVNGLIKEGAEISENDYEVSIDNKEYQGAKYLQYTLKKKKNNNWNNNKKQSPSYTLEEFDLLWTHAKKITKDEKELDTYFRCATVSGVKVISKTEMVKEAMNGTEQEPKKDLKKEEFDKEFDEEFDKFTNAPESDNENI